MSSGRAPPLYLCRRPRGTRSVPLSGNPLCTAVGEPALYRCRGTRRGDELAPTASVSVQSDIARLGVRLHRHRSRRQGSGVAVAKSAQVSRHLVRWLAAASLVAGGVVAAPVLAGPADSSDLTSLVNPLAGSLGPGFVTVGAGTPFGMVTPGAATTTPAGDDPVNYVGYSYQDPQIRGFALTHFSGAGIHIGGELPFMPTTGPVSSSDPADWASPYTHAQETAQAGYYSVMLDRYQVQAELTATTRTAVERYTFPATTQANVLLDVTRDNDSNQANPPNNPPGPGGTQHGALQIGPDNRTVTGHVDVPGDGGITMYFTARFDRPFVAHGNWDDGGGWVTFDTTSNPTVGVRVGLSYTDAAGATNNLNAEAPDGTS